MHELRSGFDGMRLLLVLMNTLCSRSDARLADVKKLREHRKTNDRAM
jgi:hypothetical protein